MSNKYATYVEATEAAQRLGFRSMREYMQSFQQDPKLPARPDYSFKADWVDWYDFLGTERPGEKYATYAEAREAAQRLGFGGQKAYKKGYQQDPKLPCSPNVFYKADWVDEYDFLGTERPVKKYGTYAEAREAAQRLGFNGMRAYANGYQKDPKLPANPGEFYRADWLDSYDFLGTERPEEKYVTYVEARSAVQRLGFIDIKAYKNGCKHDPKLPTHPDNFYEGDWVDWYDFLGTDKPAEKYVAYAEAREAAQRLGFDGQKAYMNGYQQDPKLPANPRDFYRTEWVDWYDFLQMERPEEKMYPTFAEAKEAAQKLGFTSMRAYVKGYQVDSKLRSDPSRAYKADWVDSYDFLGTKRPIEKYATYAEAREAAQKLGFDGQKAYTKGYRQDPKLPGSPYGFYKEGWVDWYDFLGTKTLDSELENYPRMLSAIESYVEDGSGQTHKLSNLKALLREVVAEQRLPDEPGALLAKQIPFPERAYEAFVYATGETQQRARHNVCVNFFDWLLEAYCSDEDDEGLLTPLPGFRNPLKTILKGFLEQLPTIRPSESVRPVLPMRSILRAKHYLIPPEAQTFHDLHLLHPFLEDCWTEIDPGLIDESDPNCVKRKVTKDRKLDDGERYFEEVTEIWSPVKLIANFILFSMPLRGQQILWLDSGEGDEIIPIWQNGKVSWIRNPGPLTRPKRQKGFLQRGEDGEHSSYITTNKTGRKGGGYRVPFMPDTLAYWVIQLREWQSKYNPISELTPWTKIKLRQKTNKDILKRRGSQAFLFRDPASKACDNNVSPMFTTTAFTRSLPAILFHSQEPGEDLATHHPKKRSDKYKSQFTPHSLRVSLITAYVVDGAAPLSVISKLVGHSSLVMTIYYTKVGHEKIRQVLDEAEKTAAEKSIDRIHDLILQKKIDEARPELIATDGASMDQFISSDWPSSAFQLMSIGICPMGGAACDEGGDLLLEKSGQKIYASVPSGYLGTRNCPRCRFFISGPAFLGGLSAISNEIILEVNIARKDYHELEDRIQELEDERYDLERAGKPFKNRYKLKKTVAAYEEKAKKLDVLATDFQNFYRLISQSKELLNAKENDKKQLIVSDQYVEIGVQLEEQQTEFRLLAEVCSNAEIYTSSSASRALPLLTQMLDKLADSNGIAPAMFRLTEDQQLKASNQVVKLIMQTAQNNWHTADQLITGQIMLQDLGADPDIRHLYTEIESIMHGSLSFPIIHEVCDE